MLAVESRKKHARFCKSEKFAGRSAYGECNGGQITDKKRVSQSKEQFDLVIHSDQEAHIEFWYARDLMPLLGYERWENFDKAIGRAIDSCKTSGIEVSDHFREVTKMMTAGKGAQRTVKDYVLTRFVLQQIFV